MKISIDWLKDFVDIDVDANELADKLTMHTVEIEEVIDKAASLDNVLVGKVTSVKKHENADTLNVCQVDVGSSELIPVVCGGSNVREGMLIAMGMVGAKVKWHGEGDLIELKKTKIRGEVSLGMICAAEEIGLGEQFPKKDEKEILDLTDIVSAGVGTPLAEALGENDIIIDVDNKSMTHRPDLWGHYGIAREVAVILDKNLKEYSPELVSGEGSNDLKISISDEELCPRYQGVLVEGVKVTDSPDWMKKRIVAAGMAPKNLIVDITNYVMLELGQPMHAFDADKLNGNTIFVRSAANGEKIETLGGDEYELDNTTLVIADEKEAIAIAGIKGGEKSGVTDSTTRIIFEAANFDAISVRKSSAKIGLRTDASTRFEKSLDQNNVELAMGRAVGLLLELCESAKVVGAVAEAGGPAKVAEPITLRLDYLASKLGLELEESFVVHALQKLGFGVASADKTLVVTVPSYRATKDISIEEDLIEEVSRIYGYNNFPVALPVAEIDPPPVDQMKALERKLTELLAYEHGYTQTLNYSFISTRWVELMDVDTSELIELDNPIAKDRPYLRRNLVPNLLQNIEQNLHGRNEVKLFEIGVCFDKNQSGSAMSPDSEERLPKQDNYLAIGFAKKGVEVPFFEVSGVVATLLESVGAKVAFEQGNSPVDMMHPSRFASILVDDVNVGKISELHPAAAEKLGIPHRTALAQINLNALVPLLKEVSNYKVIPQFPSVQRDLAILVDRSATDDKIRKAIRSVGKLVRNVELFDVYTGEHVPDGKKSMAYSIEYLDEKKTLTSGEVEELHAKVVSTLREWFGAEVR